MKKATPRSVLVYCHPLSGPEMLRSMCMAAVQNDNQVHLATHLERARCDSADGRLAFITVQKGVHVPKGVEAVRGIILLSNLYHACTGQPVGRGQVWCAGRTCVHRNASVWDVSAAICLKAAMVGAGSDIAAAEWHWRSSFCSWHESGTWGWSVPSEHQDTWGRLCHEQSTKQKCVRLVVRCPVHFTGGL